MPYIYDGTTRISETVAVHQYIASVSNPAVLGLTPEDRAFRYSCQTVAYDSMMKAHIKCFQIESREEIADAFLSNMEGLVKVLGN